MLVAQQLYCPENLAFFDAYHAVAESATAQERVEAAKELIDRFFVPQAPEELNVEHKTRTTMEGVRARLERGLMGDVEASEVFGRVHEEVRGMVVQTVWPQYKTHAAAPPKRRRGGCLSRQ
jgi:glycine cleavage system pyridoxal-binding protein P